MEKSTSQECVGVDQNSLQLSSLLELSFCPPKHHVPFLCTYILAKMEHSWKHQKNKKFLLAENSKEIFVVCLFPTKEFLEVQNLP